MVTRIQPAVSRFTNSQPTRLRAAISHTTARNRARRFTGGTGGGYAIRQDPCRRLVPYKLVLSVRIRWFACDPIQHM